MERLTPDGEPGASDAVQVWQRLFTKFRPLIGPLSNHLLFDRLLFEHSAEFPWLESLAGPDGSDDPDEAFSAFVHRLREQPPEVIVSANRKLVTAYVTALVDLIGERLATRFLHAAFAPGDAHKNI